MSGERERVLDERLSAYLDDELSVEERREVDALLEADAEARRLLEELRATVAAVRGLPRLRASDHLLESLRSRMERKSLLGLENSAAGPPRIRLYGRWLAAAAVIGLTVTAGYRLWPWAKQRWAQPADQYVMLDQKGGAPQGESRLPEADRAAGRSRSDELRSEGAAAEDQPAMAIAEEKSDMQGTDRAVESRGGAAESLSRMMAGRALQEDEKPSPKDEAKEAVELRQHAALPLHDSGVPAGETALPAVVLELSFADTARRSEAAEYLRRELRLTRSDARDKAVQPLEITVSDPEAAARVVERVGNSAEMFGGNLAIARADAAAAPAAVGMLLAGPEGLGGGGAGRPVANSPAAPPAETGRRRSFPARDAQKPNADEEQPAPTSRGAGTEAIADSFHAMGRTEDALQQEGVLNRGAPAAAARGRALRESAPARQVQPNQPVAASQPPPVVAQAPALDGAEARPTEGEARGARFFGGGVPATAEAQSDSFKARTRHDRFAGRPGPLSPATSSAPATQPAALVLRVYIAGAATRPADAARTPARISTQPE